MKLILFLSIFTISTCLLQSQPNFPSKLSSSFAIKWTQDKEEGTHPIKHDQINIFVFTSTNEDPSSSKSEINKFFTDLDLLLNPNTKEDSRQPDVFPGQYENYAPKINIYVVYVGNDYTHYKTKCSAGLTKLKIYKRSTNIVYLDDIKSSSFSDFQIGNITTCVAAVYDDEGNLYRKWDSDHNKYLEFDKIYKKKDLDKPIINGKLFAIQGGKKKPLTNATVSLIRISNSKEIKKVTTDAKGNFSFEMPTTSSDFSLSIDPGVDNVNFIILTNQKGKEIQKIIRSKKGFNYNIIDADIVTLAPIEEDEDLALTAPIKIHGKVLTDDGGVKKPLANASVSIINNNTNKVVDKTTTDKYGDFTANVSKDISNYHISVDPGSKTVGNIIIADQGGFEIARISNSAAGYNYKFIDSDMNVLSEMPEEDLKLSFNKHINSNKIELEVSKGIHYGFNETKFNKDSEPILNQVVAILNENPTIKLEVISHTDSQGDDKSNLTLSKSRSNSVIAYLVSKGISAKRLKAVGKGETTIRNRCTNGVDCSDKEHEFNRRTEFHFLKK